jgi:hypothetical protein
MQLACVFLVAALLCVTSAAVANTASAGDEWRSSVLQSVQDSCPGWVDDYAAFHRAARGATGPARYLVHVGILGVGDRMRGLMFALRLAQATRRVLLAKWHDGLDISSFVVPSGDIDWTVPPALAKREGRVHHLTPSSNQSRDYRTIDDEVLTLHSNECMDMPCVGCPSFNATSPEAACIWHRLFRVHDAVMETALRHLSTLGLTPGRYTALHLRLGGIHGQAELSEKYRKQGLPGLLQRFMAAVACANKLSAAHNLSMSPALVITDNFELRAFIAQGNIKGLATPLIRAADVRAAGNDSRESVFADIVLLGMSGCLVASPAPHSWRKTKYTRSCSFSGFSFQGWLLGGATSCMEMLSECGL